MVSRFIKKVKEFAEERRRDLFIAAIIFLTCMASFGLGRLSVIWPAKEPITIEDGSSAIQNATETNANQTETQQTRAVAEEDVATPRGGRASATPDASSATSTKGKYVASKNGTRYHFPWCPGATQIKESNKIWFQTAEAARAKGYIPAGNCSGLK